MDLPSTFSDYWNEAAQEAARAFVRDAPGIEAHPTIKAFFNNNKNGGSFWLHIQKPAQGVRLIDIEILKQIYPITLRVRIWYYSGEDSFARQHIELGSVFLRNERVSCTAIQPRQSWISQLKMEGTALEGIEYPLRDISFIDDSQELNAAVTEILSDLWGVALNIKHGRAISEKNNFPEEIDEIDARLHEGAVSKINVNIYERSRRARKACLAHYGPQCQVCEIKFIEKYGDIGEGFMHVHHIIPLTSIGKEYIVDPINDLVPVCPNCHSMIHRKDPPYSVEELKSKLKN